MCIAESKGQFCAGNPMAEPLGDTLKDSQTSQETPNTIDSRDPRFWTDAQPLPPASPMPTPAEELKESEGQPPQAREAPKAPETPVETPTNRVLIPAPTPVEHESDVDIGDSASIAAPKGRRDPAYFKFLGWKDIHG